MMISDFAVKKSTAVVVLTTLLILFGIYSYRVLPRESEPNIVIPNVFVSTSYRGASPADVETAITIELEKKLKGLQGVERIQSVSAEGNSSIDIEFTTDADIRQALQDVKDRVDEALNELPHDLENDPQIYEENFSEMPILVYSLTGTCGLTCLKRIADQLKDDMENISGVLEAEVTGGLEREIRVEVFPEKLAYYGLNFQAIEGAVESENRNVSGGHIRLGDGRFQLRVPSEFKSPEEILTVVVGAHDGHPVYLKNVARVVDGFKDETSRSRLNGQAAVNISVKKRSGENIIRISREIDRVIAEAQPLWPENTEAAKVMDKARDIELMVADLENNILSGLLLVLIVIFFTMGMRNAVLISLSIPFSMLLSFTVLSLLGITLNMVVLFSLTLALGMLVDNGIVIIENIYRFMEKGIPRLEAATRATSEVAFPVICSTVTTLAAFSPLLFWPDIVGEFMKFLPLTLIVTLSSSLFVALVINPALASIFMRVGRINPYHSLYDGRQDTRGAKPAQIRGVLLQRYTAILAGGMQQPFSVLLVGVCLLVVMIQGWLLTIGLEKPFEFFPDIDPKSMYVNIDVPEGADIDYIDRIIMRVEAAVAGSGQTPAAPPADSFSPSPKAVPVLSDMKNIKDVYTRATVEEEQESEFEDNAANHVGINFIELGQRHRSTYGTIEEIRQRVENIAGAEITIGVEEEGPETGEPICIEIAGDQFDVLAEIAGTVENLLEKIPHVRDVRNDFVEGRPSVLVMVDRQKAAIFGLSTDDISAALKSGYNGLEVSSYREGDDEYDITVQLQESDRRVMDVLSQLMLITPDAALVPLSTIAEITFAGSLGNITRVDHKRVITVEATVDETKVPDSVVRDQAAKLLEDLQLPVGYTISFGGEYEAEEESEEFLVMAFLAALLFIFLILVTMFNSVIQPFIIMTSVILSMGGAFLGLTLFAMPFGIIMTGVGVISLAGVVVNNGIVLVDYTNKLRDRGYELQEAVVAAGATRLRPVLLTAVTTILGLIPMVTGISYDFHSLSISWVSESSQWWRSMAVAVVFGLLVATVLTLVVVPILYYLLERGKMHVLQLFHRYCPALEYSHSPAPEEERDEGK